MVERGVTHDTVERDGMVEDEVGKEPPVLVGFRRVVRDVEPVTLQVLPEQFGGEGMVLSVIPRTARRALQGASDGVLRFPVA